MYREKGSKFLAFAHPVSDAEDVKTLLEKYRKEYHDARHICYAYMLGVERLDARTNDDGEPSGTAGRPILGQINSFELTNVLLVVVRYFGGVLLGTGGLIVAYKEAAADAIRNARIVEMAVEIPLTVHFDYALMNEVSRLVKEFGLTIVRQQFRMDCTLTINIPKADFDAVKNRFEKIYGLEIVEERTEIFNPSTGDISS